MNMIQRYRKLTIWNKVELWGSLASIIGLGLYWAQQPTISETTNIVTQESEVTSRDQRGGITAKSVTIINESSKMGNVIEAAMLRAAEQSQWIQNGGDSSPYLSPSFDPDKTRFFIHNDSTYTAHILYRHLIVTVHPDNGSNPPQTHAENEPLQITKKDKRWFFDLDFDSEFRYELSFSGKALNGEFANRIEIFVDKGQRKCLWLAGTRTPQTDKICPPK